MTKGELITQDYNFFSVSRDLKRKTRRKIALYIILAVSYIGLVAGFYFLTEYYVDQIAEQTKEYTDFLTSAETEKTLEVIEDLKGEIQGIKSYNSRVSVVTDSIETSSLINGGTIGTITSAIPKDVSFNDMEMDSEKLLIKGFAPSRQAVAEFISNLEKTEVFYNNFVATIETQDDGYSFILESMLKDVSGNETNG